MNNDYMNDEMEIDLIELLKHLLRNIKTILVVTLVCGLITFGVTQLFYLKVILQVQTLLLCLKVNY